MQNRLYKLIDKLSLYDSDSILLSAFDFCEINGENTQKPISKLKALLPNFLDDSGFSEQDNIKRASVYQRNGRYDRDVEEIKRVAVALGIKSEINVRGGREYIFASDATQEQINEFIAKNTSPYVYEYDTDEHLPLHNAQDIDETELIQGFTHASYAELVKMRKHFSIKMAIDDFMCVQNYFISESREPSLAELRIADNFFSESFRRTTFKTILDNVETNDEAVAQAWEHYRELRKGSSPSLCDIANAARLELESDKIVSINDKIRGIKIDTNDSEDELLLVSENESHNRSAAFVPYDCSADCVGRATKELFTVLASPYDSVRVVGYGVNEESHKKALLSAVGYAETASALGISCSKCNETESELYNEKQCEACSVLAVTNAKNVKRIAEKRIRGGDKLYVVGGKTGADGSHCAGKNLKRDGSVGEYVPTTHSGELLSLKRLFSSYDFASLAVATVCVGNGGIICAVGEMTDGADISLGGLATKYELTSIEAILSESNERMIICVRNENSAKLEALCKTENVDCRFIGTVNDEKRFAVYDENNNRIASLTSGFLLSGGAEKHLSATVEQEDELGVSSALLAAKAPLEAVNPLKKLFGKGIKYDYETALRISAERVEKRVGELKECFNRAACGDLSELDKNAISSNVSRRKLLYQGAELLGNNGKALYSALSCGFAGELCERFPFKGAYLSVVEAVLKLACAGYGENDIYITLSEYFPEHKNNSSRFGSSVASMLGCFEAQLQLGIPSLGGCISISGGESEREKKSVVSAFAFCLCDGENEVGKAITKAGSKIVMLSAGVGENGLPDGKQLSELMGAIAYLKNTGALLSASVLNDKNAATVIMEMCRAGNKGVSIDAECSVDALFGNSYASVICELKAEAEIPKDGVFIGYTCKEYQIVRGEAVFKLDELIGAAIKEKTEEDFKQYLYLKKPTDDYGSVKTVNKDVVSVLVPVTDNSVATDDIIYAFKAMGATVKLFPLCESNIGELAKKLKKTDVLWLGDTVGGNGILNAALADKRVKAETELLRERKGLIYGQGSSFESLLMSGLIELDTDKVGFVNTPFINKPVKLRAVSLASPFARLANAGAEYTGYVSGDRRKLKIDSEYADMLARNGRIITQYTRSSNVCASELGIDSVCSVDGCVLGQLSRAFGDKNAFPVVRSVMKYFMNYGR